MSDTSIKYDVRSYFFSASWCGPCKMIKPVYENIKKTYLMNGITAMDFDIDIDENKKLMSSLGIRQIPTLVVYKVPSTNELHDFSGASQIYNATSGEIGRTAMDVVNTFSTDEDF